MKWCVFVLQNALKCTYAHPGFQKFSRGDTPGPLLHGNGRSMGRGGSQGKGRIFFKFRATLVCPPFFVGSPTPMCICLPSQHLNADSNFRFRWLPTRHEGITCQRVSAKHSIEGGLVSYGKSNFSTLQSSAPNEPIKMAFGTRDYVMETTPPANFYPPTLASLQPWKGVNISCVSVPFLSFQRKAVRPHKSADFHDLCVKWRHSVARCAFWGLELYLTPFRATHPKKTSAKRPSNGKFKPKLKCRTIEATFKCVDWALPNFTIVRRKIVCTWRFIKKWKFWKSMMAAAAILDFDKR